MWRGLRVTRFDRQLLIEPVILGIAKNNVGGQHAVTTPLAFSMSAIR